VTPHERLAPSSPLQIVKGNTADLRVSDLNKFVKGMPGLEHDKKALRICFKLLEILKGTFQDPAFLQRWRLERDALTGTTRASLSTPRH